MPLEELTAWFEAKGEKKFRAEQLWDWLYRKRVTSFEEMTNLPKSLIEQLQEEFTFPVLNERIKQQSTDGTRKFLFELADGLLNATRIRLIYLCNDTSRM